MKIECAECGKEYDPDDLIDIGDKEFNSKLNEINKFLKEIIK